MSTRRPFAPPDPPPVAVPDISPALHKGTGTRSIGDRLRFWRAFAGLALALWQLPPAVSWLLDAPWDRTPVVLWEAAGVAGVLSVGIAWVLLTFRQDLAQFATMRDLWAVEITAKERGHAVQRAAARAHARRWYRQPRRPTRYVAVKHGDSTGETVKARVDNTQHAPCNEDATTQRLPELPAPTPYYGSDAYAIVDRALRGQPTGVNTLGKSMGKARHAAAMARLLSAEVMVPGQGRGSGPALAPAFAALAGDPALAHAEIARWLGAPLSPTGDRDSGKTGA